MAKAYLEASDYHAEVEKCVKTNSAMYWALAETVYNARRKSFGGTPYYIYMGFETEEEYFAAPYNNNGLNMSPSKYKKLDRIYDLYAINLGLSYDDVVEISLTKLDAIRTIIKKDASILKEWLEKARELSCSDLISEVREYKGLPERPRELYSIKFQLDQLKEDIEALNIGGEIWSNFIKGINVCCICGVKEGTDGMHYPIIDTPETRHMKLPGCRKCHTKQHTIGIETFFVQHMKEIMKWFYRTIFLILAEANEK